jgi:tetraacyldisaccharide 4'-kinase
VIHKIEDMFFHFDSPWHKLFSFLLLPLSALYCAIAVFKKLFSSPKDFGIKVISIGNLTVGGSGKTPFTIELCKKFKRPCVVMRGYGRDSRGLIVVSRCGKIECGVAMSGDEAALIAKKAQNASVIVSEDRKKGIEVAKKIGCDVVLLDDGFGKFGIAKFDILLSPKIAFKNRFCLPSGPFRFPSFFDKFADVCVIEGMDFVREVRTPEGGEFVLVSAIANPKRLDEYLPQGVVAKYYFADHHYFSEDEIKTITAKHPNATILCTEKDGVKLDTLKIPHAVMELSIKMEDSFEHFLNAKLAERFGFSS